MKLVAVLVLAICASLVKSDKEMMMKVVGACKDSTGATDDDLKDFVLHKPAQSKTQKCMLQCVMTGLGVMKNAELIEEGFKMMASHVLNSDPEKMKIAMEVKAVCDKIVEDDLCEKAAKLAECFKNEGEKHGLTLVL